MSLDHEDHGTAYRSVTIRTGNLVDGIKLVAHTIV